MKTDRNDSAVVEVYDGISGAERLLASVKVRNGTLPQSVTSTRQNLFMKFTAEPRTNTIVFVRLSSGYSKSDNDLPTVSQRVVNLHVVKIHTLDVFPRLQVKRMTST